MEKKALCHYCRRPENAHLECCPHDSTLGQMIWNEGRKTALAAQANTRSDDPTFSLGFVQGEIDLAGTTVEQLTEQNSDPPSRDHVRPSFTELELILHERRKGLPSLIPPGLPEPHTVELARRLGDIY